MLGQTLYWFDRHDIEIMERVSLGSLRMSFRS